MKINILLSILAIGCFGEKHYALENITRAFAPVSKIDSFSYSSYTITPLPNVPITIIQSPGIRSYVCQTPSGTDTGLVSIFMQLNNRFGSRFCNNQQGQLFLQIVCYHLFTLYNTKWTSTYASDMEYPLDTGGSFSSVKFTVTTSGAAIYLSCKTNMLLKAFTLLKRALSDIYNTSIGDIDFDTYVSSMITSMLAVSTSGYTSGGNLITNENLCWSMYIESSWDCAHQAVVYGINKLILPIGTQPSDTYKALKTMAQNQTYRNNAKLCLSLFKTEKDITFFIASSDPSVIASVPACMKIINDQFTPFPISAFQNMYYGYPLVKGSYSSSTGLITGSPTISGGTIFLGPISATSMIAAYIITHLLDFSLITSSAYTGYTGYGAMPVAGQMNVRVSSKFPASTNAWKTLINNLYTRYLSTGTSLQTDSSSSIFQSIIDRAYNLLTPNSAHTQTEPQDYISYNTALPATNFGYVNWMCLFQGSYTAFNDLYALTQSTTATRKAALITAMNLIVAQATTSITSEFLCT